MTIAPDPPATAARPPQPPALAYPPERLAAIPAALKERPCWVVWRYEWAEGKAGKPGKWTKVPYRARAPRQRASSTDPETWASFDDAVRALATDPAPAGLGFVFAPAAGLVGVDLDRCRAADGKSFEPWAVQIAQELATYTELSPSGTGLHLIAAGPLPGGGNRKGRVEMYAIGRFFTVTGRHVRGTPAEVQEAEAALRAVHAAHVAKRDDGPTLALAAATGTPDQPRASEAAGAAGVPPQALEDDAVLTRAYRARNGAKVRALYAGDVSAYDGDHSAADLALVNHLAFYTQDPAQLDRLFRGSGLMRPKWDEPRGPQTYGARTITEALRMVMPARSAAAPGAGGPHRARSSGSRGGSTPSTPGNTRLPHAEQDSAEDPSGLDPVVERLNADHATVWVPNGFAILSERPGPDGQPDVDLCSEATFKARMRPYRDDVVRWLHSRQRREFRGGLLFEPQLEVPDAYNLWRGFAVMPDPAPNPAARCGLFLDHVFDNVCRGEERLFEWVVGWLAQLVQHPREKLGTSLFLRGKQGTGKTKVGQALRRLLGPHYFLANESRYVTGRFNAHLERVLLLHADEAFFAGDPSAVGKLKDLVTGDRQTIERKGLEPVTVSNYVRLLGTTNSAWVVPAAEDERRFAVLDVGEGRRQDYAFFAALDLELDAGGAAALLAYLGAYDVGSVNLRTIPETEALVEQRVRSLAPEPAWWLDVLRAGELPLDRLRTPGVCETEALFDHYLEHAKGRGVQHRVSRETLGIYLTRQVHAERRRFTLPGGGRVYGYAFPPLADCRTHAPAGAGRWDDVAGGWALADEPAPQFSGLRVA